jgi:hypothetical protein
LGVGGVSYWGGESAFIINRFGILTGSGHKHFEAKAGVCYSAGDDLQGLSPSALIGYRKQKPDSGYVFRTGIGY